MTNPTPETITFGMKLAIGQARKGLGEGGIPIGSALLLADGRVFCGHNRRKQKGSAILHAEMDCIESAGRLKPKDYRGGVLFSTLSPCSMCSGTTVLYRIPTVVIGENQTFQGPEEWLRASGVQIILASEYSQECQELLGQFIRQFPHEWNEDIGEQ